MINDLVDSLFIVAVFSFVTLAVSALTDSTLIQLVMYAALFIGTSVQKKGRK